MGINDGGYILTTAENVLANGGGFYSESTDGGDEDYSSQNGQAIRVFYTTWGERKLFIDYLLGWSVPVGKTLRRVLPDQHPDFPPLYAVDASSKGVGSAFVGTSGAIAFPLSKITATYRAVDYIVTDDASIAGSELNRFCSRTYTYSSQYLSVQGYMQWVSRTESKTLTAPPGQIVGLTEYNVVWHGVPGGQVPADVPLSGTISALAGCVNSKEFDGYPAGSVLFLGADPHMSKPQLTATVGLPGFYQWEMGYKFLIARDSVFFYPPLPTDPISEVAGHQYLYDTQNKIWDLITSDGMIGGVNANGTSTTLYQYDDLNKLFDLTNS